MAGRRIIKQEHVLRDLEQRSEFIPQHNPRAALPFLEAAEATIRQLAESPGLDVPYDPDHAALNELRFFPIRRRNELVFYQPLAYGG